MTSNDESIIEYLPEVFKNFWVKVHVHRLRDERMA